MKKITVAVAAYNAENNIGKLVRSLVSQVHEVYMLDKILVYSDKSADSTVKLASEISKKVTVFDAPVNLGFAAVTKKIISSTKSDILVLLNDDIVITNNRFIQKLVDPFESRSNVGFVSAKCVPFEATNIIQSGINSTYHAFDKMRNNMDNKNNKFTCDGKVMAFSKAFMKKIKFPKQLSEMGNVDAFMYFETLRNNMKYIYVRDTVVYYKNPTSIIEYIKWTSRNNSNKYILKKRFGDIVKIEYRAPKSLIYYKLIEFVKNPFASAFVYIIGIYAKLKAMGVAKNFNPKWEVITSTKHIN